MKLIRRSILMTMMIGGMILNYGQAGIRDDNVIGGEGEVDCADTNAALVPKENQWQKPWDAITSGDFNNDGSDDLLFYSRSQ